MNITSQMLTDMEAAIRSEHGDDAMGVLSYVKSTADLLHKVENSRLVDVVDGHIKGFLSGEYPSTVENLRITMTSLLTTGIQIGVSLAESEQLKEILK